MTFDHNTFGEQNGDKYLLHKALYSITSETYLCSARESVVKRRWSLKASRYRESARKEYQKNESEREKTSYMKTVSDRLKL